MAATTVERKTQESLGVKPQRQSAPVAASTSLIKGSMVALNASGDCVPVTAVTTLLVAGMAEESVDNSAGIAGAKKVTMRFGLFKWANATAGDAITRADIGALAYGVDNQTVSDVSTGRSIVGVIADVDSDGGIWVLMGPGRRSI